MTTDIITYSQNNNKDTDNKWQCPKCLKYYSKNYPYKSHLKRCLVHTEEQNDRCDMLGDLIDNLKNELTNEFKTEFKNMLIELKQDMKQQIKIDAQPKKVINPFSPFNVK